MSSITSMLMVLGLWLVLVLLCCAGGAPQNKKSLTPAERAELQAMKDKACATMNRLQAAGGFTKIQAGYAGVTHAYVDRGFYEVDIDAKESALRWVAYCHVSLDKTDQLGIVVVHDGRTGKRIGKFDLASGFDLD